jgi:hypothetical protein
LVPGHGVNLSRSGVNGIILVPIQRISPVFRTFIANVSKTYQVSVLYGFLNGGLLDRHDAADLSDLFLG